MFSRNFSFNRMNFLFSAYYSGPEPFILITAEGECTFDFV